MAWASVDSCLQSKRQIQESAFSILMSFLLMVLSMKISITYTNILRN